MGTAEMDRLAAWMDEVATASSDEALLARVAGEVRELCNHFPAPGLRLS